MRVPFPLFPSPIRWLGVVIVAAVLVFFSLLTPPPAPPPGDGGLATFWDKKLHFAGYLAFGLALAYATATSRHSGRPILVLAAAVAFGVGIEVLQGPLPDRYFSYADMLANAIGALLAVGWFMLEPWLEYVAVPTRKTSPD